MMTASVHGNDLSKQDAEGAETDCGEVEKERRAWYLGKQRSKCRPSMD